MTIDQLLALERTVGILRDEVLRLSQAVTKLEAHAAGKSVRIRDAALTTAGLMLSLSSVVWLLQAFGVIGG